MPKLVDPYALTDLDRRLFTILLATTARAPLALVDLITPVLEYGVDQTSAALSRLVGRGYVVELPGRRFYAPVTMGSPGYFTPIAESEWASVAAAA